MTLKKKSAMPTPPPHETHQVRLIKNSKASAMPTIDTEGLFSPGLTKAEYAAIAFISAHLQAHGKYPDKPQLIMLTETAVFLMDTVIPSVIDQKDEGYDLESDDMEIDQPNSPFQNPAFR